jgi:hypothetical protein
VEAEEQPRDDVTATSRGESSGVDARVEVVVFEEIVDRLEPAVTVRAAIAMFTADG